MQSDKTKNLYLKNFINKLQQLNMARSSSIYFNWVMENVLHESF